MTENTASSILIEKPRRPKIHIPADQLQTWTRALLQGAGVPPDQALTASQVFLEASLRGVGHHDIHFLPQRLEWLTQKGVNPKPQLALVQSLGNLEIWDGDQGLGEVCCSHITQRAMDLARISGIGMATIRRSNHFLAAAPYAQRGAREGFFLLVLSNTDPGMAGPEGTVPIIGNNPLGWGLPGASFGPLILDQCQAYSSLGNLRALAAQNKSIPAHWGVDSQGRPSTKAQDLLQGGAVHPMAQHKGFGLALMVEALTGILADGATGNQVAPGGGINTHNQTAVAIHLKPLGLEALETRVQDLEQRLKASQAGLRMPGERSAQEIRKALTQGVEVQAATVQDLQHWSDRLKIPQHTRIKL